VKIFFHRVHRAADPEFTEPTQSLFCGLCVLSAVPLCLVPHSVRIVLVILLVIVLELSPWDHEYDYDHEQELSPMPTLQDLVHYCDKRTRRAAFKDAPARSMACRLPTTVTSPNRRRRRRRRRPVQQAVAAGVNFLIGITACIGTCRVP